MSDTRAVFSDRDVNWELAPAENTSSRSFVQIVIKELPTVENNDHADLLQECVSKLADNERDKRADRTVLSASLTELHHCQTLLTKKDAAFRRLHEDYAALVNERRKDRSAA
jgi:hypothetical protein